MAAVFTIIKRRSGHHADRGQYGNLREKITLFAGTANDATAATIPIRMSVLQPGSDIQPLTGSVQSAWFQQTVNSDGDVSIGTSNELTIAFDDAPTGQYFFVNLEGY